MPLIKKSTIFKILPILILGFTPLIWFYKKGDLLINGVDINFPLDPVLWFERRFFVWNVTSNAGSDFSSSTAGIFFHLIQVIPYQMGLSLQMVQLLSITFWFLAIVVSAFSLARTILPKSVLVQLLFVVFYTFNIYMFNTWENIKVANLALVSSIPGIFAILLLLKANKLTRTKAFFYSCLIGILVSGSGINPSYFLAFFLTMSIYLLAEILTNFNAAYIRRILVNFFIVSSAIILVNLFWILPTLSFVLGNISTSGSIDKLGFTNWVDSLSENTSLVNIFRLQGAWDWYVIDSTTKLPIYIPYALNYFNRLAFIIFSFFIPALTFIAFLVVDKAQKTLYITFGLMLIVGVFLGAGTHLPTGDFFRWLMVHIPFFTLFRSPWYIFSPLTVLAYAGLLSLLFYNLINKSQKIIKSSAVLGILILIIGNLIYSYPLVTGKIFRPERNDKFYVKFPEYVFDSKSWLDNQNMGRIIHYPTDELEKFSWGYRGVESIINIISNKETLFNSFNTPNVPITGLIKQFYLSLRKGHIDSAKILADKLNISVIFEKLDQESLSTPLVKEAKTNLIGNFGNWNFYAFTGTEALSKIYSADNLFWGYPYKSAAQLLTVLGKKDILLNPSDNVIRKIPSIFNTSGEIVLADNAQAEDFNSWSIEPSKLSNRLVSKDLSSVKFHFGISKDGIYQPALERYNLEGFGIDLTKQLEVSLDNKKVYFKVNRLTDSYVYFDPISLNKGEHILMLGIQNRNLISGGDFSEESFFEKGPFGKYEVEEVGGEKYLTILNILKINVYVRFPISNFDTVTKYYVELRYKQIYGNNGSVLITQATKDTLVKAQTERLPNYPEWNIFSFYYEPVDTDSYAGLLLTAPFINDPLGTKILYDDVKVYKVFNNNLIFKEVKPKFQSPTTVEFKKSSPVKYDGKVINGDTPHILIFSENYSKWWDLEVYNEKNVPLKLDISHFSANSYTNAWYISGAPKYYKFRIYYKPQVLFLIGITISGLTLLFGAISLIKNERKK